MPVTGTPGIVSYTEASAMVSYDRNTWNGFLLMELLEWLPTTGSPGMLSYERGAWNGFL